MTEELKSHKTNQSRRLGKLNKWKPFSRLISENYLFNTATGKTNHEETFVDVIEIGRKARGQFIEDLAKDSSR